MRVCFYTLGCKVNLNETGALEQLFRANGFTIAQEGEAADVFIVNSCTVTNFGDQKSRKWLRRKKRENPEFGNSGYKVFIYENGIVGTVLMLIFYIASLGKIRDRRATASAFILALLGFIVRGYPLWYSNYLTYYDLAHEAPPLPDDAGKKKKEKEK